MLGDKVSTMNSYGIKALEEANNDPLGLKSGRVKSWHESYWDTVGAIYVYGFFYVGIGIPALILVIGLGLIAWGLLCIVFATLLAILYPVLLFLSIIPYAFSKRKVIWAKVHNVLRYIFNRGQLRS